MTTHRANQVWTLDTPPTRLTKGFAYLTAVVDWACRKVLAAELAITLEACHVVDLLEETFRRYGTPEIVNTDQGSRQVNIPRQSRGLYVVNRSKRYVGSLTRPQFNSRLKAAFSS
ncbi:DDE-type integrase/transposase/recombinase, partial [Methylomicrobium sp. Wu6]|nr:DDE-type integrase/transposase/recombinase [Methylomicrobium sp. Wu6]